MNASSIAPIGKRTTKGSVLTKLDVQRVADRPHMIRTDAQLSIADVVQDVLWLVTAVEVDVPKAMGIPTVSSYPEHAVAIVIGRLLPHPATCLPIRFYPRQEASQGPLLCRLRSIPQRTAFVQPAVAVSASLQGITTSQQAFRLGPPPLLVMRGAPILRFVWPSGRADYRVAISVFCAGLRLGQRHPIV